MIEGPRDMKAAGHLSALFTVFVWGVTFVSSKVLLDILTPEQLLFGRMFVGYLALWVVQPHRIRLKDSKDIWLFVGAGSLGVFLYYFLENTALTFSYASNVGVIVSIAPVFTVLCCSVAFHQPLKKQYFIGFVVAIAGIALISFNESTNLKLNPLGDILALGAAATWGGYSVFARKITEKGYAVIPATRLMFLPGLVLILLANLIHPAPLQTAQLFSWPYLKHLLFLGVVASGMCFVTWNYSLLALGAITGSFYIYLCPVITMVCSAIWLGEVITPLAIWGTVLTLLGLAVSEVRLPFRKRTVHTAS
ncbi:MAG: DMT family transporter [Sphaerochaeta sp.]|nr:DMT family transporter [Sphaerochaeta sp.]